jgi:tripartite-type tricarboxylate transporter receptor subunit TctC
MAALLHDLRFALRRLRLSPGFTLFAVASLALGIGVSTAVYSAVRTFFWMPLGITDADGRCGDGEVRASAVGAASMIATEAVSRAVPDGNTVMLTDSSFVVSPHLRKVTYDPLTAFEPICDLASVPMLIAVNSESRYRTLAELLDAARAKPGELTLATPGPATVFQIGFEKLKRAANVNMTFVPFPGSAPAVNTLLGDHVSSAITDYADVAEQVRAP